MESFEELIECSICLETLSFQNKVLPCQHTFCTRCLQDVIKKKGFLDCPECRTPVQVDISSLPPNILLNRLLERITKQKPQVTPAQPHLRSDQLGGSVLKPTSVVGNINLPVATARFQSGERSNKCLVTLTPSNYQNVSAQPIIKEKTPTVIDSGRVNWHPEQTICDAVSNEINCARVQPNVISSTTSSPVSSSWVGQSWTGSCGEPGSASLSQSLLGSLSSFSTSFSAEQAATRSPANVPKISAALSAVSSSTVKSSLSASPATNSSALQMTGTSRSNAILRPTSVLPASTKSLPMKSVSGNICTATVVSSQIASPRIGQASRVQPGQIFVPTSRHDNPDTSNARDKKTSVPESQIQRGQIKNQEAVFGEDKFSALRKLDERRHTISFGQSLTNSPASSMSSSLILDTPLASPIQGTNLMSNSLMQGTKSLNSSPAHHQPLPIPGNLTTNPFLELTTSSAVEQNSNKSDKSSKASLHEMLKDWQLSPRALLVPPTNPALHTQISALQPKKDGFGEVQVGSSSLQTSKQHGCVPNPIINTATANQNFYNPAPASQQMNQPISGQYQNLQPIAVHQVGQSRAESPLIGFQGQTNTQSSSFEEMINSSSVVSNTRQGVYEAICDYVAKKADEISLSRGEKYLVSDTYQDGWCRGKNLRTGETGVCPFNHLRHYSAKQEIDTTDATQIPEDRLEMLKKMRETLKMTHAQSLAGNSGNAQNQDGKGRQNEKGQRYRCIVPFPASSEFELSLQVGDIISLVRRREQDGWCKGILHRTGKTGLFPATFVERIG